MNSKDQDESVEVNFVNLAFPRKRRPNNMNKEEWKRNKAKARRYSGEVYIKTEPMDEDERAREEEERRSEEESDGDARQSDHEEGASGGSERGSHEEGGVAKGKAKCSFTAKKEERLVEFFSVNPAFYDKSHQNYQNQQQKDKLLDQLAKELHTTRKQIQGWFKHMRTAVGKLYKTKSDQATQPLTARKNWQLQNFAFLKPHIVPRTYTVETTPLDETIEQSADEESLHSIPTRSASPSPSTSAAARKTKPPASKKSKIDDLLMKFLDRARLEEVLSKQLGTFAAAPAPPQPDECTAFSQWIAARMSMIPHDRWDDFQLAAMRLMQDYSRPRPNPDTSPSAQPRPMPPVQQQWGTSTQVQQPSQQPSSSSQPQIQLLHAPLHPPATAQPVRQTHELGASRSQSVPPLLDSSITGSGLTDLFMKHLTQGIPSGNTSQVAATQAASPSGTQEDSGDD